MSTLSVFILTKNESKDIGACLGSLRGIAQEIIVVDDQSTDNTVALCRQRGGKVFSRKLESFGDQKQYALDQCTGDWCLSIDADERLSPALAQEIKSVIQHPCAAAGYELSRHMFFLGQRLRFGGVGCDWVLRLVKKGAGRYRHVSVHEGLEVSGMVGRLAAPMEHYSYATLNEYYAKRDRYTSLAARDLYLRGRRYSWQDALRPAWELFARMVLKGAWLDGWLGLKYAWLSAQSTGIRARKLLEIEERTNA